MDKKMKQYEIAVFEESKKIFPIFGITIKEDNLKDMKLYDSNNNLLKRDNLMFDGPDIKVYYGFLYYSNFELYITDKRNGVCYKYRKYPLIEYSNNPKEIITISKRVTDNVDFQIDINAVNCKLNRFNFHVDTEIYVSTNSDNRTITEWGILSYYNNGSQNFLKINHEYLDGDYPNADSLMKVTNNFLNNTINDMNSRENLNYNFEGLKQGIDKALMVITPGIDSFINEYGEKPLNKKNSK